MKTVPAPIDPALLRPVEKPAAACDSQGCVAALIAEQADAIDQANDQIRSIAETVAKQATVE